MDWPGIIVGAVVPLFVGAIYFVALAMGRLVGVSPAARPLGGWRLFVRDIDGRLRLNLSSWTPGDPVAVQDAIVARSSELLREAAERWVP